MVWKDACADPGLLEYRLHLLRIESPEVEPIIVEQCRSEGRLGAKDCREGIAGGTIPSLQMQSTMAVGVRLHESPFNPEIVCWRRFAREEGQCAEPEESFYPTSPTHFANLGGSVFSRERTGAAALDPRRREHASPRVVRIESSAIQTAACPVRRRFCRAILVNLRGNIRILAVGTDLIPSLRQKSFRAGTFLILEIAACAESAQPDSGLRLGP